jgi:hypothetical protein
MQIVTTRKNAIRDVTKYVQLTVICRQVRADVVQDSEWRRDDYNGAMVQEVSSRPLTAEVWVRFHASISGICFGQNVTLGQVPLRVPQFLFYQCSTFIHSFIRDAVHLGSWQRRWIACLEKLWLYCLSLWKKINAKSDFVLETLLIVKSHTKS